MRQSSVALETLHTFSSWLRTSEVVSLGSALQVARTTGAKYVGEAVSPLGSPQGAKFVLWPFFRVDTDNGSACWKVEKFVLGRFFFLD